jgi:DNA polymerase III delta subunit
LKEYKESANFFTRKQIENSMHVLFNADLSLKSSTSSARFILEKSLHQILS